MSQHSPALLWGENVAGREVEARLSQDWGPTLIPTSSGPQEKLWQLERNLGCRWEGVSQVETHAFTSSAAGNLGHLLHLRHPQRPCPWGLSFPGPASQGRGEDDMRLHDM